MIDTVCLAGFRAASAGTFRIDPADARRARRAPLAFALAGLLLGACGTETTSPRDGGAATAADATPAATQAAGSAGEASGGVGAAAATPEDATACDPQDPTCVDGESLAALLARQEEVVALRLDASAADCWQQDRAAFRRSLAECPDASCRSERLLARLASLNRLQPGATTLQRELPPAPTLLAVLGPDPDAPEPSGPPPAPFEARGSLVHASEDPEQMGLAVRTPGGALHVFLFDMYIDAESGQRELLTLVEARAPSEVQVRGFARAAPTGAANFDTGRCRWVYQLP